MGFGNSDFDMGKKYKDMTLAEKAKQRERNAAWRAANPNKSRAISQRHYRRSYKSGQHRLKRYGVTTAQFEAMLAAQGGRCAVCEVTEPGARDWHLDHDHNTGLPRGILCVRCNGGLGLFKDSPELMERAARYLRQAKLREIF